LLRALLPNLEHFWLLLWELRWLPSLLLSWCQILWVLWIQRFGGFVDSLCILLFC
jgi:hypothetical protein